MTYHREMTGANIISELKQQNLFSSNQKLDNTAQHGLQGGQTACLKQVAWVVTGCAKVFDLDPLLLNVPGPPPD